MKEFEVTLSTKPRIKIHDPEKLENVVCNNATGWCSVFSTYNDIEDFIDCFAKQAYFENRSFKKVGDSHTHTKFIEGFGLFYDYKNGWYKLADEKNIEEFGQIEFYFDDDFDLEVDWPASEIIMLEDNE